MTISIRTRRAGVASAQKAPSLMARVTAFVALRRERKQLLNLDAHLLEDIGVTPAEAVAEARKSSWDAPAHWHN